MKRMILCLLVICTLVLGGCQSADKKDTSTDTQPSHTHAVAEHPQTIENPLTRTSQTLEVTVSIAGEAHSFQGRHALTMTNILFNLAFDPAKVCDCEAEYTVDTQFGTGYQINLTHGFVRCEQGQADLTTEQIYRIREVTNWVESPKETETKAE